MKYRTTLLSTLITGALLFAGTVIAQDVPPPPAPVAPMPPPPPPPAPPAPDANAPVAPDTAAYQTPQGEVTVHSEAAPAPTIGPAPSFEQLSGGSKGITEDQAAAYPPLANDFIHADTNRNGSVSKAEYARWVSQPQ
ncbi:MAG TPA: hypothetical protein VIM06_08450 [Rhodanobacter sp.]